MKASKIESGNGNPQTAFIEHATVWMDDSDKKAKVYDRDKLRAKDIILGPAIITEMDSTTLVLSDHVAEVDDYGNILINPAK